MSNSAVILLAYLLVVKLIAVWAYRGSKRNLEDYYLANRSLGVVLLVATVFATVFNAMAVTSTPAHVMEGGILFFQFYSLAIITPFLMYSIGSVVAEYGRERGLFTAGEVLGEFYKSRVIRTLSTFVSLASVFPFLAVQFVAVGKIVSSATQGAVTYELAVIVLSVTVSLYLLFGGSKAVVWTDVVQGLCFFSVQALTVILFLHWAGGIEYVTQKLITVIPEKLTFNEENTPVFIDRLLSWPFAFFFWPHVFQRCFMAGDKKALRQTAIVSSLVNFLGLTLALFIGMAATVELYGEVADHDRLVAEMYAHFWPAGAVLILLTAFASGMSTVDSMLLSMSAILIRSTGISSKKYLESTLFNLARVFSLLAVLLTTAFALNNAAQSAIAPLTTIGAALATLFLWPFLAMCYFKKPSAWVSILTMLSGALTIFVCEYTELQTQLPFGTATASFIVCLLGTVLGHWFAAALQSPEALLEASKEREDEFADARLANS